jgi:hypothetical protein
MLQAPPPEFGHTAALISVPNVWPLFVDAAISAQLLLAGQTAAQLLPKQPSAE